jgi:methyl-accepting chemotaxis protein
MARTGKVVALSRVSRSAKAELTESEYIYAKIQAIDKVQAIIEFSADGTVYNANENFLKTMGYTLEEIQGKHHRIFCDAEYVNGPDYRAFWDTLNRGDSDNGVYRRIGKGGKEIWIQASYNPVRNRQGRVVRIVKFAMDISEQKLKDNELSVLSKVQAVDCAEQLAHIARNLTKLVKQVRS